ncbi:unnamed protein product [Alopecurus aequalis]
MPRRGSIWNKAKATFDDATVCLPRDVLAGILLRLPASDLCRVCKEWREPEKGAGYLLDEHWRVTARFTVSESEDMVGACNGLLCLLDVLRDTINIVEPFTGEFITLPLPPKTENWHERGAYRFGFDPSSRRYKIFHLSLAVQWDNTAEQDLYVYTIGGGKNWRRVHITGTAEASISYSYPVFADGSLCWSFHMAHQLARLARFNLATEEITSMSIVDFLPVDGRGTVLEPIIDSDARIGVITIGSLGKQDVFFMGEGGRWTRNNLSGVTLPQGRHLARPYALQRGHLLLKDLRDGGLCAHLIPVVRNNDLGPGKLLLERGKERNKMSAKRTDRQGEEQIGKEKHNTRGLFFPALSNQVPEMVGLVPRERNIVETFCYAPPVSPAPLAHRCGFPCGSPKSLGENKV